MTNTTPDTQKYRNQLKLNLLKICPDLNLFELEELTQKTSLKIIDKNEIFIKADSYSDSIYFIVQGMVRVYYEKEGKEITNVLLTEGDVIAGSYSYITGGKNFSNYQALEYTLALCISNQELEELYQKYHSIERLGRKIVERYYASFMKKTYDVLFLSTEERYNTFVQNNRALFNRISLKYIASYLGITQETLSRLRSKH